MQMEQLRELWDLPLSDSEKGRLNAVLVLSPNVIPGLFVAPTAEGKACALRSFLNKVEGEERVTNDQAPRLKYQRIHSVADSIPDSVVPFTDVKLNLDLEFRGRDAMMRHVAQLIDSNFTAIMSHGFHRERVQLIAVEGLAGVGKTRFLLETKKGVAKELERKCTEFAKLHRVGATAAVYISFNGSAVGGHAPHFLHPDILEICKKDGSHSAGRAFLRVCVASQVIYSKPWGALKPLLRHRMLDEDDFTCVQKIAVHVKEGLGLGKDQMVALYLLVDESQQLGSLVFQAGWDGDEFVRGMFSWVVNVMSSVAGGCIAKTCKLAFVTLLAGTILPVGGRFGVSDWLKRSIVLKPLELQPALEVVKMAVGDDRYTELLPALLESESGCIPRLIRFLCDALVEARAMELPSEDLPAHLRASMVSSLAPYVDRILRENRDDVKRMVRLCFTEMVMQPPPIGQVTPEVAACFNGYVYSEEVVGGVVYKSPLPLLYSVGLRVGIPARMLRPELAAGEPLEHTFLDLLHAKLCVWKGQTMSLGNMFPGAAGDSRLLNARVKVEVEGDEVVNEKFEFYSKEDGEMIGEDGMRYEHPSPGYVFRCKAGVKCADGRLFLLGEDQTVYELWFQIKGESNRVSVEDADEWAESAFSSDMNVQGRRKVLVLCSRMGFSFHGGCTFNRDVLLVDLGMFMPRFLKQDVDVTQCYVPE